MGRTSGARRDLKPRWRRRVHVAAYVEAGVWRLDVPLRHLADADAVLGILHGGVHPHVGDRGAHLDPELAVAVAEPPRFLPPVAEDVAVAHRAIPRPDGAAARAELVAVVVLGDGRAADELALEVTVPPDRHVGGVWARADVGAARVVQAALGARPALEPAVAGVDVGAQAAPDIPPIGRRSPDQIAGPRVAQRDGVG